MEKHQEHHLQKSHTQVKGDMILANGVTDEYVGIKLKLTDGDLSSWHQAISDAFSSLIDLKNDDFMGAINDINWFDEILYALEEIMENSPEGGTLHLTTKQLHMLLRRIGMSKIRQLINDSIIQDFLHPEGEANEMKHLANRYFDLNQVIGIAL